MSVKELKFNNLAPMIGKIFFIITTLILVGCSNKNGEFTINGSVNLEDGNMVYRIIADANNCLLYTSPSPRDS